MDTQKQMADEIGQVIALDKGMATVVFDRHGACARCKACGMFAENQKKVSITLPAPRDVQVNDWVRLTVTDSYYLGSVLLLYGLPCLALILGVALGFSLWGPQGQGWAALLGFAMTAAVYLAVRSQNRRLICWRKNKLKLEKLPSD